MDDQDQVQIVTPWEAKGAVVDGGAKPIDLDRVIQSFGVQRLEASDIARFEKVTGHKAHHLIRRGLFFAHRDLHTILDLHEQGKPFYLYTGRGPSNRSIHLGHAIPFSFCKYLQDVFDVPLVIQLTDDEKFMFKNLSLEECTRYGYQNAREIAAFGFNPEKTFMFLDSEYYGSMFRVILKVQKCLSFRTCCSVFGFDDTVSIGKLSYPCAEIATCFSEAFPHLFSESMPSLIPCAIDQDPYFRLARDIAPRLGFKKPCTIYCSFISALQGFHSKMSSSIDSSAIFMDDTPQSISKKIKKYAFSGGQADIETHRKQGGNPDIDVAYQYLRYIHPDDQEIERIADEYRSGKMLTGELKQICIETVSRFIGDLQKNLETIDENVLRKMMGFPGHEFRSEFLFNHRT